MTDSHLHAPSRTEFRWPPPQNDCGVWVGNQQQEVNADLSNKFFFRKLTGRCGETDAYMMNHSSVRILGQRHHRTNSLQNTDSQTILVWKIGAFDKITPHVMQLEMFAQIMQFNGVWCTYLGFLKSRVCATKSTTTHTLMQNDHGIFLQKIESHLPNTLHHA